MGADLTNANLREANLTEAKLSLADLIGANLLGAYAFQSDFSGANLLQADLCRANFRGTDFRGADLGQSLAHNTNFSAASLCDANLEAASLIGVKLDGTDFAEALVFNTVFADVDLSEAKGLECVEHSGPSTLGIDTILRSSGKIPDAFLRGCGVPEEFIAYIGSIVGRPIEYYSCFISYSTKDQAFADRLYADLQAKGVRCWFAPHDIRGGRKIHEQIDEAIRVHDKLLLILSEHSMASDWVGTEIADARERESQEKKQMLFPITIAPFEEVKHWKKFDADRGTDSAREIREYYIPDFSRWESDNAAYQKEFEKLVAALKAGGNL